ncbi:hypothetical protein Bbelb_218900 [Branchiostoma belcheri]|nr:hypothetical protein Bbelb_218900 [Branchiostoma belcheri]
MEPAGSTGPSGPPGPMGPAGSTGPPGPPEGRGSAGLKESKGMDVAPGQGYNELSGMCYKAFNDKANFNLSAQRCSEDGGTLAMPRDPATNNFLVSIKNAVNVTPSNSYFWFGLHDQREEGSFQWVDGTSLERQSFTDWAMEQPDNKGNEDCVHYFHSASSLRPYWKNKWNDVNCNESYHYICQVAQACGQRSCK